VKKCAATCGIDNLAPHDPRRTCARLFMPKAASWNRSSSYSDTLLCRQPSVTLVASRS
jgi:hypothetical protein